MLVYNVHGLVHLAEDARRFGCLDNISAFPFENVLGKLKRMVRKPSFPLQQIIRRLHEKSEHHRGDKDSHRFPPYLKKKHNMGPVPQKHQKHHIFNHTICPHELPEYSLSITNTATTQLEPITNVKNVRNPILFQFDSSSRMCIPAI